MDCSRVSTRLAQLTTSQPGTMKKAERLSPPPFPPSRPAGTRVSEARPLGRAAQPETQAERIQRRPATAADISRRAESVPRGREDKNLRRCYRRMSLMIFHYNIRVQSFNF